MKKSFIPNAFTFINLSCGILSILATINDKYMLASLLILLSGLVDRYDGRVARFLNVSSELGKELDSLADLVAFGVAPAILSYVLFEFNKIGPYGMVGICIMLIFVICGAYRLARFNTIEFDGCFTGIPITIAGCFIAIYDLLNFYIRLPIILSIVLLIIGAYLMVSNIRLKKV